MSAQKVGVIGLGNMGGGIARNFNKAGVPLMVWDVNPEARNKFMETSGVEIAQPGEMAAQCAAMLGKCASTSARGAWLMSSHTQGSPRRLHSASMQRATTSRGASSARAS